MQFVEAIELNLYSISGGDYLNIVMAVKRWWSDEKHYQWLKDALTGREVPRVAKLELDYPRHFEPMNWDTDDEEEDESVGGNTSSLKIWSC